MSNRPQPSPHDRELRAARILELRRRNWTWVMIGKDVDLSDVQCKNIYDAQMAKAKAPDLNILRQQELESIQSLEEVCYKVLNDNHYRISPSGKVVYFGFGDEIKIPLEDSAPLMQAIMTIKGLKERKAKMLGLDAATKIEQTVIEVTEFDRSVSEWINEDKARQAAQTPAQRPTSAEVHGIDTPAQTHTEA